MEAPNHNERTHAENSPSSLHRRVICPGSREAEKGRPDTTSKAAEVGTQAHELLERYLNGDPDVTFPSKEMQNAVMEAVRWVKKWVDIGYTLQVEVPLDPSGLIGKETKGSCDIVLIRGNHVIIADFKYGQGKEVHAKGNEQLLGYAAGVQCSLPVPDPLNYNQYFTLAILQPRLPTGNTVKTVDFTFDEISAEWAYLRKCVDATYVHDAARVPEADACFYCKAKLDCGERTAQATRAVSNAFAAAAGGATAEQEALLSITDGPVKELSDEYLAELYDLKDTVTSLFKDLGEMVEARIRDGRDIPGYKIIQGAKRRKWRLSDAELRKKFKGMKLIMADYEAVSIKSPNALENTEEVKKKLTKDQFVNLATFWEKTPGADRLVISAASGIPIVFNSDQAFSEAEGCTLPDSEPLSFL